MPGTFWLTRPLASATKHSPIQGHHSRESHPLFRKQAFTRIALYQYKDYVCLKMLHSMEDHYRKYRRCFKVEHFHSIIEFFKCTSKNRWLWMLIWDYLTWTDVREVQLSTSKQHKLIWTVSAESLWVTAFSWTATLWPAIGGPGCFWLCTGKMIIGVEIQC